jgi:Zn-dependent protease
MNDPRPWHSGGDPAGHRQSRAEEPVTYEPSPALESQAPGAETSAAGDATADIIAAELAEPLEQRWPPRRRVKLPVILFFLTAASTWFAGATNFPPSLLNECALQASLMPLRRAILRGWDDGLIYMMCIMLMLLAHEMGHFAYTVYYRVRASLPFFLPMPIIPLGTMGAVIAMDGRRANRPQTFDIGIAGPLAGLIVILPVMWYGVVQLDFSQPPAGGWGMYAPLLLEWLIGAVHPGKLPADGLVYSGQANAWFVAGWFGLLMTALNMFPVSQLDGGHVTYTLWGRFAHWFARGFMVLVFAYIVFTGDPKGLLMAILVMIIGTDHPPTADDGAPLGWFRVLLGYASLAIPVLCFPPRIFEFYA